MRVKVIPSWLRHCIPWSDVAVSVLFVQARLSKYLGKILLTWFVCGTYSDHPKRIALRNNTTLCTKACKWHCVECKDVFVFVTCDFSVLTFKSNCQLTGNSWPVALPYITKTCLFKYTENFTTKKWKFAEKKSDIFHISAQNIDCGYSLEPPRRGGSNEYPQAMFLSRKIKKCIPL